MMEPNNIEELRAWGRMWWRIEGETALEYPTPRLLVVDPGGTTGLVLIQPNGRLDVWDVALSALPGMLHDILAGPVHAVICEDYSVHGKNVDPKAWAAIGKGMVWSECDRRRLPMFLLQPNMKLAGRKRLNQQGLDARARAKNDHQRDVIDLAGKALHEIRKAQS